MHTHNAYYGNGLTLFEDLLLAGAQDAKPDLWQGSSKICSLS
jgi:hypothetical protein